MESKDQTNEWDLGLFGVPTCVLYPNSRLTTRQMMARGTRRPSTYSTVTTSEEDEGGKDEPTRSKRLQKDTNEKPNPQLQTSQIAAVAALSLIGGSPSARSHYSTIRSGIIRFTPETMKCKLYCRGPSCRYCSWKTWSKSQMAISGLYSNWITENILAMARLTKDAIEKFDVIKQFKDQGIVAVFNLQCQSEHAYCGPSLLKCGFTYDPELLMKNKIYYYNWGIPDFEFCTIEVLLDIIKVMCFSLTEGKIAVHCHAGLGRTGAVIACFLVLTQGLSAEEALIKVREARPNSVQSTVQVEIVEQLEELLHSHARVLPVTSGESLSSYFVWQNAFLPNEEARRFPHVPKLVFEICCRLLRHVFEADGVTFRPVTGEHRIHSCTFGELNVKYKNCFSHKGRARNRYVVNILVQIAGFPYERDHALVEQFRRVRVSEMCPELDALDVGQLLHLLHEYMMLFRKPLASKKALISWLEVYSLESTVDSAPKTAYKDWHCLIFFLCNVLSYLTLENYDVVTELITYWLLNDVHNDVKQAVHAHMRGLYARNLREQESQVRAAHDDKVRSEISSQR